MGRRRHAPAPPRGDWLYLVRWLDSCSRKTVGRDVRDTVPKDLVSEALRRVLAVRRSSAGLRVHSDRGRQFTATRFKELLTKHGAPQSMSRRGNCSDAAESFWSRFKAELLGGYYFPGLAQAQLEITHDVAFYNAKRRPWALGYHAPNNFKTHFQTTSQRCKD
ncbi:DDE-type integrase/transposase/recombinase [Hymenobacter sp. BT683]|uniref:DDE-type integrase/transposase/recombinase n=1 Tax=Hymenobacter jeongseonensis TaxID=2791027 RepID=A0ABS0IEN7_9BACT|nr:DDE-type integrase/transposase/recombinase [Hymenobacter jeongseonensis]